MNDDPCMTMVSNPVPAKLSRAKLWGFRLFMMVGVPLILLLLVELALRLSGYGHSTAFFIPSAELPGKWTENSAFGWRFFPQNIARAPLPMVIEKAKAPDRIRIIVLGESAARGEPEPAFSFSRMLEILLREQFPERKFEIINTGVTAINSHAILPIARDVASLSADFWVVYMGNNEFVGPFGPGTVFGARSSSLPMLRASLALKSTRLGQALLGIRGGLHGNDSPAAWEGLEMFTRNLLPPDDPRLEGVYRCFHRNLEDILDIARDNSGQVLLCTVGVNLADGAPFASAHRASVRSDITNGFARDLVQVRGLLQQNRAQDAFPVLDRLAKADGSYAEVSFLMGRALLASGRAAEARGWLQKACDEDALKFRADSRLNTLIRHVAGRSGERVQLVDIEAELAKANTNGIPGDDLFLEHVHPTFEGNYQIAQALARSIGQSLAGGKPLRSWLGSEDVARRLGLTDWHQLGILTSTRALISRPPFSLQSTHARRDAGLQTELAILGSAAQPSRFESLNAVCAEAVERSPDDWMLLDQHAQLLASFGKIGQATNLWGKVEKLIPHHFMAYYRHGSALNQRKTASAAEPLLRRAIALRPEISDLHYELAVCLGYLERFNEAELGFQKAIDLRPTYMEAYLSWGLMLLQKKDAAAAIPKCERALELSPNNASARMGLIRALMLKPDYQKAIPQVRDVLSKQPTNVSLRLLLVDALHGAGDTNGVISELQGIVETNPQRVEARNRLAVALSAGGRWEEAETQFAEIVQQRPEDPVARFNLGRMYFNRSLLDQAEEHLRAAVKLSPTNQVFTDQLRQVLDRKRTKPQPRSGDGLPTDDADHTEKQGE